MVVHLHHCGKGVHHGNESYLALGADLRRHSACSIEEYVCARTNGPADQVFLQTLRPLILPDIHVHQELLIC